MAKNAEEAFTAMTDEELVLLANNGSKEAERALVLRFTPLVQIKSRPYFLVGADKEDLVQEGLIGLVSAIRDFDPEKKVSFRAYAEVCITNNMLAAIKRSTRKKHMPLNTSVSLDKPISEEEDAVTFGDTLEQRGEPGPEELVIMREAELDFASAFEKELTPLEMQVLRMFLNGLSYKQIAEKLNRSVKAADNALQRIKRKAARLLESED